MPERFDSQIYTPEAVKLMKDAFDEAWRKVGGRDDADVVRKLLASAIIDQVNAGVRIHGTIVAAALAALSVPKNASPSAAAASNDEWPDADA